MTDEGREVEPHRSGGGELHLSKQDRIKLRLMAQATATAAWECYKRQTDWHGGGEKVTK